MVSSSSKPHVNILSIATTNFHVHHGFPSSTTKAASISFHLQHGREGAKSLLSNSRKLSQSCRDDGKIIPLVKMCGITSAEDAEMAAEAGADLIGMILWPNSKRSVSISMAKEISKVARSHGAEPVAVFVDDDADTIQRVANASDIEFVQLHGNGSREAFPQLGTVTRVIYVLHARMNGDLINHLPDECCGLVDWVLVDSVTGGSGQGFNWEGFKLPRFNSKHGWLLAGGMNSQNVGRALISLRPDGVDVSSGICGPDGIKKDRVQISSFLSSVRSAAY